MYTTPLTTIGAEVSAPAPPTLVAPLPVRVKLQACLRSDTLADEITAPVASRVLARSPLAYGQDPDGTEAPGEAASATPGANRAKPVSNTAVTSAEHRRRLAALGDKGPLLIADSGSVLGCFHFVTLSSRRAPITRRSG